MFYIYYAKKEMAFEKWRKSGYNDFASHAKYIHYFNLCQKEKLG
jgi:hypothetical protein